MVSLSSKHSSMFEWALLYVDKGWSVLPLHSVHNGVCTCEKKSTCRTPGKHPRVRNGVNNATKNHSLIKAWWSKWPNANIGIATGKESGLVVLDVDPAHGGKSSLDKLTAQYGEINTLCQHTGGGGWHFIFKYPSDISVIKNRIGTLGKGLDIKADKGYIVACPSNHVSGDNYALDMNNPIMPMPEWLLDRLVDQRPVRSVDISESEGPVYEGGRNNYLTKYGGKLVRKGIRGQKLKIRLLEENRRRCVPVLDDAEVRNIAKSLSRYIDEATDFKFNWRKIVLSSEGPKSSTTRLVLLVLFTHMNSDGGSCYPTIVQIAEEAALSEKAVKQHLKQAGEDGWVEIYEHQGAGQAWRNHGYLARLPEKLVTEGYHVNK